MTAPDVHQSTNDGTETVMSWEVFRAYARTYATHQQGGDGGVKVIENVTILSFDDDNRLTIILGAPDQSVSYTILT